MRPLELNIKPHFVYQPSEHEVKNNKITIRSDILNYCKQSNLDVNIYSPLGYNLSRSVLDIYMDGLQECGGEYTYQGGGYTNYIIPLFETKYHKLKFAELTDWEKALLTRFHWSWFNLLRNDINDNWFGDVLNKINGEERSKREVYPSKENVFKPFETDVSNIRVVVLNDNPYPNKNANGLAFASNERTDLLKLIETSIAEDLNLNDFKLQSDLSCLVNQGVLLLNTSLTYGHAKYWRRFIQRVLEILNDQLEPILFILMGDRSFKSQISNFYHSIYEIENPMIAINENRKWNYQNVFKKTINLTNLQL